MKIDKSTAAKSFITPGEKQESGTSLAQMPGGGERGGETLDLAPPPKRKSYKNSKVQIWRNLQNLRVQNCRNLQKVKFLPPLLMGKNQT